MAMTWYTERAIQDIANGGKPVCAWIPLPYPSGAPLDYEGKPMWIIDSSGRVKDFANPDKSLKDTDPWQDKWSIKKLFRKEV